MVVFHMWKFAHIQLPSVFFRKFISEILAVFSKFWRIIIAKNESCNYHKLHDVVVKVAPRLGKVSGILLLSLEKFASKFGYEKISKQVDSWMLGTIRLQTLTINQYFSFSHFTVIVVVNVVIIYENHVKKQRYEFLAYLTFLIH